LAWLREVRAVEPLIDRLKDKDEHVRRAACQALGWLGNLRAMEFLIERLGDKNSGVRHAACQALGPLGHTRAAEPLIQLLEDPDWVVRQAACQALGEIGDARAVEPLIHRLTDQKPLVQRAACQALGRLIDSASRDGAWRERLLGAADPLIERLKTSDWDVRGKACRALESIGEAIKDLHQLFCRSCLARLQQQDRRLVPIPVCRLCGRAGMAMLDVREVVAVLDTEMGEELSCSDGVARVSYLQRDAPFDFDRVEIVRAGDYEVERFCVQVGNDADPFRQERYRRMRCLVGPGCRLSENTLRVLKSMLGEVSVKSREA
jgi:hypothetical protein